MVYVVKLLEAEKEGIERSLKERDLMRTDMKLATAELRKVTEIKKALKILKAKREH